MDFDEYQQRTSKLLLLDKREMETLYYLTIGLTGEAGEVSNAIKKIIRDNDGKVTEEKKQQILKELGDVLWYLVQLSDYFDTPIKEVAESNIIKLEDRMKRGKIKGSGDNR